MQPGMFYLWPYTLFHFTPDEIIMKKKVYACIPQFCYIKVGFKGVYISWTFFLMNTSRNNNVEVSILKHKAVN